MPLNSRDNTSVISIQECVFQNEVQASGELRRAFCFTCWNGAPGAGVQLLLLHVKEIPRCLHELCS